MNDYGYFTDSRPRSPVYHQIGQVIRDIQINSQTLNKFLTYSQVPELYQYLEKKYGRCEGAVFNPSNNSLVYKNKDKLKYYKK